jgi:hypothetical protein
MTYPQAYQQFPPSPLHQPAQQQPQYGAPQGTPWMPPQYGGQPAQPAGPVGGQAMPTQAPALGQPARSSDGGPKAPAPRHLVGRTILIEPLRIDEDTKADDGSKKPTAYYNITVIDGGPLQFGDNKSNVITEQHGYTLETDVPARFTNVSTRNWGFVQETRDTMARGDMAAVGVVEQGERTFFVTKCATRLDGKARPDGAERFERATLVWNDIFAKRFVSPEPRSLVAAPSSAPPQVQYQPQPAAPVQQPAYAQEYAAQTASGFQTPYAAANPGTGPYGDGPGPQQPAYGQTMAPWGQTYQPPSPLAQAVTQQSAPPANPAFEAYIASLPPEQQAAARAQFAPQPQQPAQPAGPGF